MQSIENLASWIQECRRLKLNLDIHRVARFAVYCGHLLAVKHLVEKEGADLTRRDVMDRSAIFYALPRCCASAPMLEYVLAKMHNGSTITDLNRKDREHRTPLHYAAIGENVDCVELLFALDANIEIKDRDGKTPKDLISPNRGDIMLLFAFKKLLQLCPEFTYADYSPYETNSYLSLETLQVNTEPNECRVARENIPFTWLHIPWTNVCFIIYLTYLSNLLQHILTNKQRAIVLVCFNGGFNRSHD